MLEIKDKELVRTRIEEALKAIETLRDILLDANVKNLTAKAGGL